MLSAGKSFKPHKYILLLVVLELIQENHFKDNKIFYEDELKSRFKKYIRIYGSEGDSNRPHTPFFHLKSSGFWYLKAKPGKEEILLSLTTVGSPKDIVDNVEYAYLSDSVYNHFIDPVASKKIKEEIISILEINNKKDKAGADIISESSAGYKIKSLFLHEEEAIKEIKSQTQNIGKLLYNVMLYDKQSNNYFEIDILLATNFGIFVIELKHWSGHIRVQPYNWVVNDINYRSDPRKVNNFKAKIVKGIYQHRFKTFPDIWVESVVVFTNPDVTIEGAVSPGVAASQRLNNPTFASIGDLITYLKKRKVSLSQQILDNQQVDAVISYFSTLDQPKQIVKYSVPGYETVEYISQRPECIELIARPLQGFGKGLYRFRIFRIPQDAPQKERERFLKKAHNTIQSVSQIGDHPHIHKVWMIENEVGDIIEGSEWSETGTLRDLILKNNHLFQVDDALQVCCGIAEALKEAHKNNVIHRAVKPENILMLNGMPKLINFDLAYQLEDNRLTVIEDASKLKDDGYIAPEVVFGQDIDESTDLFSLGVIAYELLTGGKPFPSAKVYVAQKGKLSEQAIHRLEQADVPHKIIDLIENMLAADRHLRIKNANRILATFKAEGLYKESEKAPLVANRKLEPGSMHDVYEIVELIGEGEESQIYKARTIKGRLVALKLFNKEVPRERIFMEAEVTSAISSSYVVRCENKIGHWENDRYFIVLEYVPGISLRNIIEAGEKPDLETFKTVAIGLMEAIRAFHYHKDSEGNSRPFLHSDIKPDNIIITKDKRGILIDCGISGEPRIDTFRGTIGYVPPDCLSGADMSFSEDGDLFALGVTLWEWLFGCKPYENPSIGDMATIPVPSDIDLPDNIKRWLLKAVATEADNRFSTVDEMQQAFTTVAEEDSLITPTDQIIPEETFGKQGALVKPKDEVIPSDIEGDNPFVSYLNSLSNASAGNENATAEAQITSEYFSCIEVGNPITEFVYEKLTSERCNIILTGNAGDGKTTIAMEIFTRLSGERRPLNPQETLADQGLVIIKDMSELDEEVRISILNEAVNSSNNYLIISNTGTLIESFGKLDSSGLKTSDSELLKALEADGPCKVFDDHFLVLNIGRIDSIKTACAVFTRMLEHENWEACLNCARLNECPIYTNVLLLQERFDIVHERIMLLYRRLFEYSVRLTMRQMTGHLAYAITAGLECKGIMAMSQMALEQHICGYLFFNRFFGDDGADISPAALQLFPVRQIIKEEFGMVLDPEFERKAWMKEGTAFSALGDLNLSTKILNNIFDGTGPAARRQLRRLVYFFGYLDDAAGKRFISIYLRSPMLLEYIDLLESPSKIPPLKESRFRSQILQVMQEHFIEVKLPEDRGHTDDLYITVRQQIAGTGAQMVLADFRTADFKLVAIPWYTVGAEQKRMLCLQFNEGLETMKLDLPFFDYVARRYEGEVTEELSAYYADRLERFKVELIEHFYTGTDKEDQHLRLLMIDTDRKFKLMRMAVDENKLEVL